MICTHCPLLRRLQSMCFEVREYHCITQVLFDTLSYYVDVFDTRTCKFIIAVKRENIRQIVCVCGCVCECVDCDRIQIFWL
jgi:Mn-dependent DtxR family transcriptional regulator